MENALLSAATTLFGGILLFILGQWVLKFLIEPAQEQTKTIHEIARAIVFYSNATSAMLNQHYENLAKLYESNDPLQEYLVERQKALIQAESDRIHHASDDLRRLACELLSRTQAIPHYAFVARLFGKPAISQISDASRHLIGLANSVSRPVDHSYRVASIARDLQLTTLIHHLGIEATSNQAGAELAVAPDAAPPSSQSSSSAVAPRR
jgi:hypothetical protein